MNRPPPPPPALKPGGIRRNVHHIELMPPRNVQQPILSFNNQSLTFLLNVLTLLMGSINVGIIGYNFSYYKGSYRKSLFQEELTFLVVFCIALVLTATSIIVTVMKRGYNSITDALYAILNSMISCFTCGFSALFLLIQLNIYGRYFVEQFETKIFCGFFGIIQAIFYGLNGYIQWRELRN